MEPQQNVIEGLSPKDWNAFLDRYLETGTGDINIYYEMNEYQQSVIQEIKKSLKRLSYKYKNETTQHNSTKVKSTEVAI